MRAEGQNTGPYRKLRCIGVGAHAQVWLARGPAGVVALKIAHPAERTRLRAEGALLARLHHPNIVRLLQAAPDGTWLALEHIDGAPIHRWAAERPLPEAVEALACLADALAHLHRQALTHGDLKPDNALVDSAGRVCLIDLGLAGPAQASASFQGSLGYAAPEQLLGAPRHASADIYALGAIGYRLLAHRAPFQASDQAALLWLPVSSLPLPPSAYVPHIPHALEVLILRMLARTPAARPRAPALAQALRGAAAAPAVRPVVGMFGTRSLLRQRLIEALEGACPVLSLLGGRRSGRGILIEELLDAAHREGLQILRKRPQQPPQAVLDAARRAPFALRLDAPDADIPSLCAQLQAADIPGIVLVHTEQPVPTLPRAGWLEPQRLDEAAVALLLQHAGQDVRRAADVLRITGGLPGVVYDYLQRRGLPSDLTAAERALLVAVGGGEPRPVRRLALRLAMSAHELLDLAEPLIARGLLVERRDGACLQAGG